MINPGVAKHLVSHFINCLWSTWRIRYRWQSVTFSIESSFTDINQSSLVILHHSSTLKIRRLLLYTLKGDNNISISSSLVCSEDRGLLWNYELKSHVISSELGLFQNLIESKCELMLNTPHCTFFQSWCNTWRKSISSHGIDAIQSKHSGVTRVIIACYSWLDAVLYITCFAWAICGKGGASHASYGMCQALYGTFVWDDIPFVALY